MEGRGAEVAQLAGVPVGEVRPVSEASARALLAQRLDSQLVGALFRFAPPRFWQAGDVVYLDDPLFGPVVPIDRLDYDPDRGLYIRQV
ncbi:MAG: hypothetical protein HGA45_44630 [Chloroflexales bacterium]|nr:hypothetical protein [Chloroflexales bacterium]